jgi:hypothetical protein
MMANRFADILNAFPRSSRQILSPRYRHVASKSVRRRFERKRKTAYTRKRVNASTGPLLLG